MDFVVVRLGKDSISDITKLNDTLPEDFEPYTLNFTCKQVERAIQPGAYAFIYLGSDNNKGIPTRWHQGMRALGQLVKIEGWENFQSTCTLKINVFSVFKESLDQISFLEKSPNLYKHFSEYPVIGVKSSRNNSVQRVNEGPRKNSAALLTSINSIYHGFKDDLKKHAPVLVSFLGFNPAKEPSIEETTSSEQQKINVKNRGVNVIFYGAPGTGKSFAIDKTIDPNRAVKTVFHAETMNSDFVGSIKPIIHDDGIKGKTLTYEFLPGPFIKSLLISISDPAQQYWLVIEEINRASAAAVFGEIFQLLDRRHDGRSTYEIDFPDHLCEQYVNSQLKTPIKKLFIPSNLSLFASMNSSDQGVLSLDTAFKRRWKFTYISLDFEKGCTEGSMKITLEDGVVRSISWSDFAQAVNTILAIAGIPEDRHLGPYFLSKDDLEDPELVLTGKLFMYLWDDVLRHGLRYRLFDNGITTYGQLVSRWGNKMKVFNDDFIRLVGERVNELDGNSVDS
jgi:AAA domain (dynein-related subfamily)